MVPSLKDVNEPAVSMEYLNSKSITATRPRNNTQTCGRHLTFTLGRFSKDSSEFSPRVNKMTSCPNQQPTQSEADSSGSVTRMAQTLTNLKDRFSQSQQ